MAQQSNRSRPVPEVSGGTPIELVFVQRAADSFGGGRKMLLRLLTALDDDAFNVTLLSQQSDELCRRLQEHDVTVEIVPYRGSLDVYNRGVLNHPPHKKLAASGRLLQYNAEVWPSLTDADVIWCDSLRTILTLAPSTVLSSVPVIWNVGLGYESTGVWTYLNEIGLRTADRIFVESERQARNVFTASQFDRSREKFVFFHKGIDTQAFSPRRNGSARDALRVGTAALITPRKGLHHLIDAAATISREREDVRFPIAGEPVGEADRDYLRRLERRAGNRGVDDRIEFLGWVEDMPDYYASLDVFVLPSLNEGIPGSVREALAMEVPVIATDVGGTSDAVRHGETGLLVEPEDPAALADALGSLLDHPDERARLGANGRRHIVEQFSVDNYVRDYERLFVELAT